MIKDDVVNDCQTRKQRSLKGGARNKLLKIQLNMQNNGTIRQKDGCDELFI